MSRNLLHRSKLAAFVAWCAAGGVETRPPRGDYDVLQVRMQPAGQPAYWACVFDRNNATEHYTVDRRLEPLVRRFIRSKASAA